MKSWYNKYYIIIILIISLIALFVFYEYKKPELKDNTAITKISDGLSYNQAIGSAEYIGQAIEWQGKISAYYSQITGIKFCVIDLEHQAVDINQSCDWFWAFSENLMGADDKAINPNWDGRWVDYTLGYYKVSFDKSQNFYNDVYTIKGIFTGIDCVSNDQCVPNIDIISIVK